MLENAAMRPTRYDDVDDDDDDNDDVFFVFIVDGDSLSNSSWMLRAI